VYAFLWRLLPGPLWLRILLALGLIALVVLLLVMFVFPWLNSFVNTYEVTVEE
jgi:ABC-type transporter Mla subunit MlaD